MSAFSEEQANEIRAIAEEEARNAVASFSGLALRRLQEEHLSRSPDRNMMEDVLDERLSEIFGEALQQYAGFIGPATDEERIGIEAPPDGTMVELDNK